MPSLFELNNGNKMKKMKQNNNDYLDEFRKYERSRRLRGGIQQGIKRAVIIAIILVGAGAVGYSAGRRSLGSDIIAAAEGVDYCYATGATGWDITPGDGVRCIY